jgi:hypothetical protein
VDPVTAKYAALFDVTLEDGETISLAGLGQHVQSGEQFGRGQGEGAFALTEKKFLFRFDDPPPGRSRFLAFPVEVIASAEAKWIVVPGMSELALWIDGPSGSLRANFYMGKREAKQIAVALST